MLVSQDVPFSLRLSAHLMFGTARILCEKAKVLKRTSRHLITMHVGGGIMTLSCLYRAERDHLSTVVARVACRCAYLSRVQYTCRARGGTWRVTVCRRQPIASSHIP